MAIVYQSTSVSDVSAAAAGILAQNAIRDALLAHPSGAWTLEEEFDAGGLLHWTVLKNSDSLSDVGFDFYVCIGRVIATGQLGVCLGELYTASTNTLSVFAPRSGLYYQNSILADFSYSTGGGTPASFTLGSSLPNTDTQPLCGTPTPAATMRFISIVEKDYAMFLVNNMLFYVGALFDDIVPVSGLDAAVPVGCFNVFDGNIGTFGGLTRHPIDPTLAPMAASYVHSLMPLNIGAHVLVERQAMGTAVWTHPDRFQGGRVAASEFYAIMAAGTQGGNVNNAGEKTGVIRGRFKNLRYTTFPWAATVFDTIVVDGRKHVVMSDHGGMDGTFITPYNYNASVIRRGLVCDTGLVA